MFLGVCQNAHFQTKEVRFWTGVSLSLVRNDQRSMGLKKLPVKNLSQNQEISREFFYLDKTWYFNEYIFCGTCFDQLY